MLVNHHELYAHDVGEGAQLLYVYRLGEHRVVGGTRQDPGLGAGLKARQGLPQGARHRQFRHGLWQVHHLQLIDHQPEAIAHVDEAGVDRLAGWCSEQQTGRVGLLADPQMLGIQNGFVGGDGGAHLQHVGSQYQVVARLQVVGVVLHEGGATRKACPHHLDGAQQGRGLPVPFGPEAEALLHQALAGQPRQLVQAVEILEGGGEGAKTAVGEEFLHPQLLARRLVERCAQRPTCLHRLGQGIALFVLGQQRLDIGGGHGVDDLYQIADRVVVDLIAELDLGLNLVTLGDRHVTHVVAKAGDLQVAAVVNGGGDAHPVADLAPSFLILPVADHHCAWQSQAGPHETELAPAVGGLVQVHEVHVDLAPGQIPVELGVELQQGFLQLTQGRDPHLGGGEGVHPHHEPNALLAVVGIASDAAYFIEGGAGGLEHYLDGQPGALVELAGDGVGVIGHLFQGGGAIQVLAADQEPHFQLFHQFHLGVLIMLLSGRNRRACHVCAGSASPAGNRAGGVPPDLSGR
ncbi:hypothetical protein D3C81_1115180 [compost metagenome]